MTQKPHRLRQRPTGQGVRAEATVIDRKTHRKTWILQIGVVLRQNLGPDHALVDNRPAAQGSDINVLGHLGAKGSPHTGANPPPQAEKLPIKPCVVRIAVEHPLLNNGSGGAGQGAKHRRVHRNNSPTKRLQAERLGLVITEASDLGTTGGIGRHEHHPEAPRCTRLRPDGF